VEPTCARFFTPPQTGCCSPKRSYHVPSGKIELAIAVVVEQRRHQDVVADKELIIDPNAGWILWLLQMNGGG